MGGELYRDSQFCGTGLIVIQSIVDEVGEKTQAHDTSKEKGKGM